jgi:hypothetical protein
MICKTILKIVVSIGFSAGFLYSQAILSISPPRVPPKNPNDTFWVSIKVEDVVNLKDWQAKIVFNPEICTVLTANEGPFLKRGGMATFFATDIGSGYITLGSVRGTGGAPGTYGSGILANINFKVKSAGSSILSIERFEISGPVYYETTWLEGIDSITLNPYYIPFVIIDGYYGSQGKNEARGEFSISTAANDQTNPTISVADTQYLVSWQDYRAGSNWDVYGQRISRSGNLLGVNFNITSTLGFSEISPTLSWNDSIWICGYKYTYSSDTVSDNHDIFQRGITGNSSLGSRKPISNAPSIQRHPSIAFNNGGRHLVVWEDYRTGQANNDANIYGKILNRAGDSLTASFLICNDNGSACQFAPSVVWGGNKFLVVWSDGRGGIRGQFVDSLGNLIGSEISIGSTGIPSAPSLAYSGTNFLVVWLYDYVGTIYYENTIYGQLISPNGNPIGSNFVICNEEHYQTAPSVFYDGVEYVVLWQDERNGLSDIYGQKVLPDGTLSGPNFPICTAPYQQVFPVGASNRTNSSLVVWTDLRNGSDYDIWGYMGSDIGIKQTPEPTMAGALRLVICPNPFRDHLEIKFQIPEQGVVSSQKSVTRIKIYNATGRLVKEFNHLTIQPFKQVVWDGTDLHGYKLPAGIYFCELRCGDERETKKVVKIGDF